MKKLKWIGGGVVLLIIVAVVVVFLMLNGIVRSVVETQATSSLNLQTTLGGANVSLLGGSLGLSDLQIASPKGYEAPRMFTLDGVKVGVSVGHLRADPIAVDQIVVDKPHLVIEQSGGKFNFQTLMDQPSAQPAENDKPATGTREAGQPIRLIINDLKINNAVVVIRPGIPGLSKEINVPIPSVELKDIGTADGNKNGVAIKQVVMLAITALAQKATELGDLPPEVKQLLSLNVDQVKQQVTAVVNKQVGKITSEITKQLPGDVGKDAGKAIEKGLGGLLGGDKKPAGSK
ncbi:MAG TPA: AsmA family protein [Tepidisphaeraceae bacterium]|nr:AsmA family protein [Tepidisphaeraceae bacterium]